MLRILSEDHVVDSKYDLLPLDTAIQLQEEAFKLLYEEKAQQPSRLILTSKHFNGSTLFKPAYVEGHGLGAKMVSVRPDNSKDDKPTVPAAITLIDEKSGMMSGIIAARELTGIRTAGSSALATQLFSNPNSATLTIFGSGLQAKWHILTICCIRNITSVYIVSRSTDSAQSLINDVKKKLPDLTLSIVSMEEGLSKGDIICTTTSSNSPLFDSKSHLIRPGTHINAIGSYMKNTRELDGEILVRAKIVLDVTEAREVGEFLLPPEEQRIIIQKNILGHLGQILVDKIPVRTAPEDITVYKGVGAAVQDIVTASFVLNRAIQRNVGSLVPFQ